MARLNFAFVAVLVLCLLASFVARGQRPQLSVQTGHSAHIKAVVFSPDGTVVASSAFDSTVKLWDVAEGRELRTLNARDQGHGSVSLAFSPDGRTLAGGGFNGSIKLWDVASGRALAKLTSEDDYEVFSVAFSPDGKLLAGAQGSIHIWDVASGRKLFALKGHTDAITSIAFSTDNSTIFSGGEDKTIRIWNLQTQREQKVLKEHSAYVTGLALSTDGRHLASADGDWNVKLWDVSSGRVLWTKKRGLEVSGMEFSSDGRTIAIAALNVEFFNTTTGQFKGDLKSNDRTAIEAFHYSPDGKLIVTGDTGPSVHLWDVATGKEVARWNWHAAQVSALTFRGDGRTVAIGSTDHTVRVWDLASGQGPRVFKGHRDTVNSLAFSPDGKLLASGDTEGLVGFNKERIIIWDVNTGQSLHTLFGAQPDRKTKAGYPNTVSSLAFSPDGKMLASASHDKLIKLWDVKTGRESKALAGHTDSVRAIAFNSDGRQLLSNGYDNAVRLWDVATGRELSHFQNKEFVHFLAVAFAPDGRAVAIGWQPDALKLLDISNGGSELFSFQNSKYVTSDSAAVSVDVKTLAVADYFEDGTKLWDLTSGAPKSTLKGHTNDVNAIAFSPDGKLILTGSSDGTTKLWNAATGEELASLIALDQDDWMVAAPNGLFDGSPGAWHQVLWRLTSQLHDVAPVEAFFGDFFFPGLLSDIFGGKEAKAPADIAQKDRRQPNVTLTKLTDKIGPEGQRNSIITLQVSEIGPDPAHNTTSGAQDVRLFRNGSLVKAWRGDVLKGQSSVTLEATVPIVAGENKFTAYAFNHDNVKSSDAELTVVGADRLKRPGTAYLLAIGINKYSNPNYRLNYAVADAEDFAGEIKRQQESLKRYASVEVISLTDAQATKANITAKITELATRVQPEDAVIIYFAGHGTAQGKQFYLLPHDLGYNGPREPITEAGLQSIIDHSISDRELEKLFEGIDAGQLLLVIDACNSGQALEAEEKRRGPMNSKGLAQLAYEKGMYVMTAAQSYQAANEAAKFGHGFLTYALIETGLKQGAADREPKNGAIDLREWLNFATEEVPKMQENNSRAALRGTGNYIVFVGDGTASRGDGIGAATGDDKALDNIQRPRIFYRRELETNPFVVGTTGAGSLK